MKKSSGKASGFAPTSDHWHFSTSSLDAKPVTEVSVSNLQGIFRGHNANGAVQTIAVAASYDSFSAAPVRTTVNFGGKIVRPSTTNIEENFIQHLLFCRQSIWHLQGVSLGTSQSGLLTVMELARLYAKLFSKPETRPQYNLLFILTGGSILNQAGLVQWTAQADPSLLESVSFVLCIDDLVGEFSIMGSFWWVVVEGYLNMEQLWIVDGWQVTGGNDLNLHVSRISREENIRGIYEVTFPDFSIKFSMNLNENSEPQRHRQRVGIRPFHRSEKNQHQRSQHLLATRAVFQEKDLGGYIVDIILPLGSPLQAHPGGEEVSLSTTLYFSSTQNYNSLS